MCDVLFLPLYGGVLQGRLLPRKAKESDRRDDGMTCQAAKAAVVYAAQVTAP